MLLIIVILQIGLKKIEVLFSSFEFLNVINFLKKKAK